MKKETLFLSLLSSFMLFSCNDDASANRNNEQDVSNTTIDDIGTANEMKNDSTREQGDSSAVSTQTQETNRH